MEHVDEYLRAAAWMGASPLPSVRSRPANLHAGCGPHSRDRGRRDRAHCPTSQPRLKKSPGTFTHPGAPRCPVPRRSPRGLRAVGGGLGRGARDHGDIPGRESGAARVPQPGSRPRRIRDWGLASSSCPIRSTAPAIASHWSSNAGEPPGTPRRRPGAHRV